MSEGYDELRIEVPRAQGETVCARLLAAGSVGLQEVDPDAGPPRQLWDTEPERPPGPWLRVQAWFAAGVDRVAVERALQEHEPRSLEWSVDSTDWEAETRAAFPLLEVGPFTVAPPWNRQPGAIVITPGSGFGTGDHPTTRAMLVALAELAEEGQTILDVGCGSGILTLAAAQLGLEAFGVDVAPEAVEEAKANALQSGLKARFDTTPIQECSTADGVLANLHAEVLIPLAAELKRVTRSWLVLGGIRSVREADVLRAFAPWKALERVEAQSWVSLRFRVPSETI